MNFVKQTLLGTMLLTGLNIAQASPDSLTQRFTFDDLKIACENPAAYHSQIAPTNIQISCIDVQSKWIVDTSLLARAPITREVTAAVSSDKYSVDSITRPIELAGQEMQCARYKEVSERVEAIRAVKCSDILAFTGDETDFCMSSIDLMRAENPAAIVAVDTGRTLDLCPAQLRNVPNQ